MITFPFSFLKGAAGTPLDPDAAAFLSVTGITDPTIVSAINDLVLNIKGAGMWVNFDAIYPFVGGTASTCKYNLKDPQDTNAAYRITFNGSWTIDANGVKPSFTDNNNWADTHWSVTNSPYGSLNDHHHFYRYINEVNNVTCNYAGAGPSPYMIMGACSQLEWFSGNAAISLGGTVSGTGGFSQAMSRTNSTTVDFYRKLDGGSWGLFNQNNTAVGTITSNTMMIGAVNFGGGSTNFAEEMRYAFLSLGQELTSAEASNLDDIVTSFNTALGRAF